MSNEKEIYVEIGTGFSFHPEPTEACREAIKQAVKNIGRYDPSVCFVFAAQRYAGDEVPSTIRKLLGKIPVLGCTTAGEILDGPRNGSLSVVLIASPFLNIVRVWSAEGANRDPRRAIQAVFAQGGFESLLGDDYRKELRRAGKSLFGIMFTAGKTGQYDTSAYEIFNALREATSFEIPFFGGCAAYRLEEKDTNSVFVGDRAIEDGLAVAVFETSLRHGMGMYHGFVPQEHTFLVTRAEGQEIAEIDGKPVVEILPSLLEIPERSSTELSISALTGKTLGIKTREQKYIVVSMSSLTDRGTLRISQPVPAGTPFKLMIPGSQVEHVGEQAASMALWRGNIQHPAVLFMFSCVLLPMIKGNGFKLSEFRFVKELVGACPVVGFYSFGEQGVVRDGSNVACHGAVSCLAIGNELTDAALTYLENRRLVEQLELQSVELKKALEDWKKTFDHAPFGIMVVDQDLRVRQMNRTLQNILSIPEGAGEYRCHEIFGGCDGLPDKCFRDEVLRTGKSVHCEFFEPRLNKWFSVTVVPVRDETGTITSTIHFIEDVTDKKRFEEVQMLARKFETATTIAGGIAHDFNNLLTVISGNIELAMRDISPKERAYDKLSMARDTAFKAADLVRKLLSATMHVHPHLVEFDLSAAISTWLADLMKNSTCRYRIENYSKDATVVADPDLLKRAIENVLKNAEEAMKGEGEIVISLWDRKISGAHPILKQGSYLVLAVKDTGAGIRSEQLYRVFDPYFSTKQRGTQRGMGLGLAESLSIVSAMGGTIEISSREGVGTTVYIYIPMATDKDRVKTEPAGY